MGLFRKKFDEMMTDPDKAKDFVNGKSGFMSKIASTAFSAEERAEFNQSMDEAKAAMEMAENMQNAQAAGQNATYAATGKVLNIQDTRTLIHGSPRVILTLEVTEAGKAPYQYQLDTVVSAMAIPRVGDNIQLGRSDQVPDQLFYMGIVPAM